MMYKIDYLTLVSGKDVLIPELQLIVRQPKIEEIAMLGEKNFYTNCYFLLINKEKIINHLSQNAPREELEEAYKEVTEYQILATMASQDASLMYGVSQILDLLFPDYEILYEEIGIIFCKEGMPPVIIRDDTYDIFREALKTILCLNPGAQGEEEFNPGNDKAREIAEKLKARKRKLEELKNEQDKEKDIIGNYVSALAIGTNAYTLSEVMKLSLFQLFDQIKRFGLREQANVALRAHIAGAKDVEHIDWLGDLK